MYELLHAAARGEVGIDPRCLHGGLDRREEAVAALVRFTSEERGADAVFLEDDLIALFRALKAPEALPFYLAVLRRNLSDVPDALIDALVECGAGAVDGLLELYNELDEEESGEVAFALAALRVRDERILDLLLERLDFDAVDGAMNLALYGNPAAAPALRRILDATPESDTHIRTAIQAELRELENPVERIVDAPFDIWDDFPEKALPDFYLLGQEARLKALAHEDAEFRAGAAATFFNETYEDDVRAKLFEAARHDTDAAVRARCWEALLGETGEPEIREEMLAVAGNREAPIEERAGAAVGLAQEAGTPAVRAAIEELYDQPEARAKALEAMWRSLDRQFGQYFPRHIEDPDRKVQRAALLGAGHLGLHTEAGRIEKLFDDDDVRSDALFAYAMAAPGETSPSRMRALLRRIDRLAGGLDEAEEELVMVALDQRLDYHGMKPVFSPAFDEEDEDEAPPPAPAAKPGRNDPCPCGSGKKYKKCCGA